MKSLIFSYIFLCVINNAYTQKVEILPKYPERNKDITIIYNIKDKSALIPDTVTNIDLVFSYSNFYEMPNSVPLKKIGDTWQTTFQLPRYFLFASFYLRSGTYIDRPDTLGHFVIYPYINEKPVARAILNHGYSLRYQMGKRSDLEELQSAYFKKEIEAYPDSSYEARLKLLMYEFKIEKDSIQKKEIREKAQKIIADNFYKRPGNSGDLNQTTMGYLIIGENSRLDSIRNIVRQKYPKTQAGYSLVIDSISQYEDTSQIISNLERLVATADDSNKKYLQDAYVHLFNIFSKKKNAAKALKYLKLFNNEMTPYYPAQLYEYSKTLYENGILLDTAYALVNRSYSMANLYPTGLTRYFPETGYIPSFSTAEEKKETELNARSTTTALKSAVKMKQGKKAESIVLIKQAIGYSFNAESARYAYRIYSKYKLFDSAYNTYKRLVLYEPENVEELMGELKKTYIKKNAGKTARWKKEETLIYTTIKNKLKEELNKQIISIQFPDIFRQLQKLDGTVLPSNFGTGKVVFINFWATWCVPCMKEMPFVNKVWEKYKNNKDVEFMIINSGANNTIQDARGWNGNNRYSFPVYFNNDKQLSDKLHFNIIPATFIVDKEGIIRFKFIGFEGPIIEQKLDVAIEMIK